MRGAASGSEHHLPSPEHQRAFGACLRALVTGGPGGTFVVAGQVKSICLSGGGEAVNEMNWGRETALDVALGAGEEEGGADAEELVQVLRELGGKRAEEL